MTPHWYRIKYNMSASHPILSRFQEREVDENQGMIGKEL